MPKNNSINTPFPLSATEGGLGLSSPSIHGVLVAQGDDPVNTVIMISTGPVSTTMKMICGSIFSEGIENDFLTRNYVFSTPMVSVTAQNNARTHAISIQPATTFNGLTNRTRLIPTGVNICNTGNNPVLWELCIGQQLTTPSWTSVNSYSATNYDINGTLTGNPLVVIHSGFVVSANQVDDAISQEISALYPLTLDHNGDTRVNGTLTLLLTGIGGTSTTKSTLLYSELR